MPEFIYPYSRNVKYGSTLFSITRIRTKQFRYNPGRGGIIRLNDGSSDLRRWILDIINGILDFANYAGQVGIIKFICRRVDRGNLVPDLGNCRLCENGM